MQIVYGGAILILVVVLAVTDGILGLEGAWSALAVLVAEAWWWQSDLVWELGTRRVRKQERAWAATSTQATRT
ncbi:hypothetical protein UC35_17375 [Ramlibacter tataouinensis]|uniref:Uncharacterized protein n=2 Tax=Ramlibacter tataouinensis TaxID=94132 RepID=A0A127JWM9_9BURK|nr:hypothetical protein UC35_17375 [Ramlibacter tataouinensis]